MIRLLGEKLFDTSTKAGPDVSRTTPKNVVHKTAEKTGELIGNKVNENFVKQKHVPEVNSRNVEETVIPPEKRQELIHDL